MGHCFAYIQASYKDLTGLCFCIYHDNQTKTLHFQMLILQQSQLHNIYNIIYWPSSPCMSKALCRVTSKVFLIYTSSMWRSTVAAASWVLRGSSEWGGNGVWHVDSGVNPPWLLKRLLLEFNHPAIEDTLWSWEGWLMSMQHTNYEHQLIQKLQYHFGWMIAIQWWGNRISFKKTVLLFFPNFTLPIILKTGYVWTIDWSH